MYPQLEERKVYGSRHDIRGLGIGSKLREVTKGGVDVGKQNKNIGEGGQSLQEETEELDNKALGGKYAEISVDVEACQVATVEREVDKTTRRIVLHSIREHMNCSLGCHKVALVTILKEGNIVGCDSTKITWGPTMEPAHVGVDLWSLPKLSLVSAI